MANPPPILLCEIRVESPHHLSATEIYSVAIWPMSGLYRYSRENIDYFANMNESSDDMKLFKNASSIKYFEKPDGIKTQICSNFESLISILTDDSFTKKRDWSICLEYSNKYPTEEMFEHICAFRAIKTLEIMNDNYPPTKLQSLCRVLSDNSSQIHKLIVDCGGNNSDPFTKDDFRHIFNMLKQNTTITNMTFTNTCSEYNCIEFDADDCTLLADVIKCNTSLTCLTCTDFRSSKDGAEIIADALKCNRTLKTLDLDYSDTDTIIGIIQGLKFNHSITQLFCSKSEDRQKLVHAFEEVLEINTSICDIRPKYDEWCFYDDRMITEGIKPINKLQSYLDRNQQLCKEKDAIL